MADDRDTLAATKLTRTEFAVVRAYAQGMRPVEIANRYLLDPDDDDELTEHQAVQRILALRDRLVQFALQHDRPDIAEMFEALRGRSDTGMTRRVEALSSIEQLGQGRPLASHRVSLWFGPNLARRLMVADVHTIADLVNLANRHGTSWWRHVPRIGRQSCETIVRWLATQQAGFDIRLREFVQVPSDFVNRKALEDAALGTGMRFPVPLESMRAPAGTSIPHVEIGEDLGTVREWLKASESSPNTWKSYRREAERILLWAARQGRSLRSLGADDLRTYASFLADPQPADFWCGPAGRRDRVHWRPFEGPLRTSSCEAALRVVRVILGVVRPDDIPQRTRRVNVRRHGDGEAPTDDTTTQTTTELSATQPADHQLAIARFLEWLASDTPSPRQRAALAAALLIARHGLRVVELPTICFAQIDANNDSGRLACLAKSAVRRGDIELAADVWQALTGHWRDRGLDWHAQAPGWNPDAALLAPIDFPDTERGRAKRALASAGYSASGLDRLLRSSWQRFSAANGDVSKTFTPRQLRLA